MLAITISTKLSSSFMKVVHKLVHIRLRVELFQKIFVKQLAGDKISRIVL